MSGHLRRHRRHRQEVRSRGRRRDQRPHPSGLCLRDRRTAGHQRRQIRHPRHHDRSETRSRDAATSSAPRPTMSSSAPAPTPGIPNRPRCWRPTTSWPRRSPTARRDRSPKRCRTCPNDAGESALGDIIADAQLAATQADRQWRRRDRVHQSRRHPRQRDQKRRRRGVLRRPVRQPAVPQPAGDADADRRADQECAGAAMARPEAAADSAGLEWFRL